MLRLMKGGRGDDDAETPLEQPPDGVQAPENDLNAEISRALVQFLVPYLGPVARHLVRSTAASCNGLDELADTLSLRIPDEKERNQFLHAVATSGLGALPFHEEDPALNPLPPVDGGDGAGPETGMEDSHDEVFTAEQLDELTRALAYYVGPLAPRLVQASQGKVSSMEELNLAVAKSISDPDDWAKFLMTRRRRT